MVLNSHCDLYIEVTQLLFAEVEQNAFSMVEGDNEAHF